MSKINNYYLSNDSKNIILVYDNFTSILNLNTNKEIKIIDKELDKITFSKDGFFFCGIFDNYTIFNYNFTELNKKDELHMNLSKDDSILKLSYCKDNKIIILTQKGYIYHFKDNHIVTFNNIDQIKTSSSIKSIDISKDYNYFGVLCKNYFFILLENYQVLHLPDIYFLNKKINKIIFCPFDEKIFYLLSDNGLIKFKINSQMKLIIKFDEIEGFNVENIQFNSLNKNIIILNNSKISYIYYQNNLKKLILLTKIKYPNIKFFYNYKVFYYTNRLILKSYVDKLINLEFRTIDKSRTQIKNNLLINYKTMEQIMNNQIIQYDHSIECPEIDYIKKIHLFIFLTKIPYFFNYCKDNTIKSLKFPIKKKESIPDFKAIDQFIKFVYTDVYPDSIVIFHNLNFFKEISDKLWYGKENNLKTWVDKVDAIYKEYIL